MEVYFYVRKRDKKKSSKDCCVHDRMRRMTTKGKIIDTHCQRDIWRRAINGSSHSKQHIEAYKGEI